jgi:ribosomal-protein-alanine N-acetyltransferase
VNSLTAEQPVTIRPFRAVDFDRLWEIDQLCFPPGIAYTQMDLSGFMMQRNAITLVAEIEATQYDASTDNILGFAVAQPIRKVGRILTLDILPEARRLGLGSRLMKESEDRLLQVGCSEVYLETAVNNEVALRLYHKLGYRVIRTLPDYYPSHSLDAFLMGKQLSPTG